MVRRGRIILLALASRLVVLTLMVVSDAIFPDLDSSARLQNRPCDVDCAAGAHRTWQVAAACDTGAPEEGVAWVPLASQARR